MSTSPEPQDPTGRGRRLWTPWRMEYVGGEAREEGCVFCNRLRREDDVSSLILHRADHSFVILNLYPYNTGHVMIVPNQHVASPEDADPEALSEMAVLAPRVLRALRRVLACHGFNLGLNVGSVAGAGVADHLHQHVVPRWNGDANFMPILAGAMVIPELIPASYAKIRAELTLELGLHDAQSIQLVLLDPERGKIWLQLDGTLPTVDLRPSVPIWQSALHRAQQLGIQASVAGWAGERSSGSPTSIGLTLIARDVDPVPQSGWVDLGVAGRLGDPVGATIRRAQQQLSTLIGRERG